MYCGGGKLEQNYQVSVSKADKLNVPLIVFGVAGGLVVRLSIHHITSHTWLITTFYIW